MEGLSLKAFERKVIKYPHDLYKMEIKTHRDTNKQTEMRCFSEIREDAFQREHSPGEERI